ncbi:hypothetical protein [Hyphomicrobium sp. DY-1]|uniref:hypothetical protein n=1 Tax=Hyphomicrobium sp. DY-1 TaxID=3075650 RepID=UPI0039C0F616
MAWALGSDAPQLWRPGAPAPTAALDHIRNGGKVVAHNAPFELAIWNHCLTARVEPSWPKLAIGQTDCTMARAQALSLPAGLGNLAIALGLEQKKDKEGHALMMRMSRPRKILPDGTPIWWDDPAKIERLGVYCIQDVIVERPIDEKLPELSPIERQTWLLDRRINNRGLALDIPSIQCADDLVEGEKTKLDLELFHLTGGKVEAASEAMKLCGWLRENGFPGCNSIAKPELAKMLEAVRDPAFNPFEQYTDAQIEARIAACGFDFPARADIERVLQIREQAGKASTAKLAAMLAAADDDGRARELFGYHAASTGRWNGRRLQPQNLRRPSLKFKDIEKVIDLFPSPDGAAAISMCYGDPIDCVSQSLRSLIVAGEGRELIASDFSNIEGRMLAWLAGEEWKLDAFRDFDAGIGHDLYILSYARSFNLDAATIHKDDPRRQIGKVQELSLGYQGSVGAFQSMGANYGLKLVPTPFILVDPQAPVGKRFRRAGYEDIPNLPKLPEKSLYEIEVRQIVKGWRAAHPAIKAFWKALENAALDAIADPGTIQSIPNGKIRFKVANGFLWMRLPSGRALAYANPSIGSNTVTWTNDEGEDVTFTTDSVFFWAEDPITKQWVKQSTYGGSLAENATQAASRDILRDCMFRLEKHGYPIVLHVHDEPVAEILKGFGSVAEFEQLMTASEPWAAGLPVAVSDGYRGFRYRKG